jgi:signal transduction histidine kinase
VQFDRRINEQQGSGMGLAIVNKLINLHQGEFKINSVKDKFTEVIVKIPVSRQ